MARWGGRSIEVLRERERESDDKQARKMEMIDENFESGDRQGGFALVIYL